MFRFDKKQELVDALVTHIVYTRKPMSAVNVLFISASLLFFKCVIAFSFAYPNMTYSVAFTSYC